jgi:hypothetical protein
MNFFSTTQTLHSIVAGLRELDYRGPLLAENYSFSDWFAPNKPERCAAAVAFGQTPISYDTALIGIGCSNGLAGSALVDQYRALGVPFFIEVGTDAVREWAVAREEGRHGLLATYAPDNVRQLFVDRNRDWRPEALFRAKNIGKFHWTQQLSLFAGLLPELEERIQESLDPLLRDTLSRTKEAYRESTGRDPEPSKLFKLVFWLLTAKVFRDRGVAGFDLPTPDPDDLLTAVAKHHKTAVPNLLNRQAREAAAQLVWNTLDFRNLSVEVLSQIWASTLVDDDTKARLGIHRTSRTIVRYIIDRIPLGQSGDDPRIILEPCCGSGVFLVGAMNALRPNLFLMSAQQRHDYFVKHMVGIEKDPFGAEISRLALTLADFPNPNNWAIEEADVFAGDVVQRYAGRAGVVLCNPPFADFDDDERSEYKPQSPKKPVELLNRVLDGLHSSGVLGFVLPRAAVDGRGGYADLRLRLAKRFATIDMTVLPDRAFAGGGANPEIALLVATEPIVHDRSKLFFSRVYDSAGAWDRFTQTQEVSFRQESEVDRVAAESTLSIPELPDVWDYLVNVRQLGEVSELHRGIEWNEALTGKGGAETGTRKKSAEAPGFIRGIEPRTKFNLFEIPPTQYLSVKPEHARGSAYARGWSEPKVIVNKSTRSRGRWRMSAFADSIGLTCYQTYIGVWPKGALDEVVLAAVLNGPVANAFVCTREGKTDITMEILEQIPVPVLTAEQSSRIRNLVAKYRVCADDPRKGPRALMEIDAAVLDGYRMPPRIERRLLDFFHGEAKRPIPFPFPDYPTWGHDVYFSLSFHLSGRFEAATASETLKRMAQ